MDAARLPSGAMGALPALTDPRRPYTLRATFHEATEPQSVRPAAPAARIREWSVVHGGSPKKHLRILIG